MSAIAWSGRYSVGVAAIDDQHRQLFEIMNKLDEAIEKNRGERVLTQVLREMVGYTQEHFAFEEKLLAEAGFPGLEAHQARHRRLIQEVERFDYELNVEGRRISREVRDFLQHWLVNHIAEEDQAYAQTLTGAHAG